MNTNEQIAHIAEQLIEQIDRLSMANAVQTSAYLALARHLAVGGLVDLTDLAIDLDMLGSTEAAAGWKSGHAEIADGLRLVAAQQAHNCL